MAEAKPGDTVRIHYKGSLDDGTVFDTSHGRDPFEFTLGAGMVIPGFDNAVKGMEEGTKKQVAIEPEDAYGEHRDDLVINVPKEQIPEDITPEIGMGLQLHSNDGRTIDVVVSKIGGSEVTLDGNHPLAGKRLNFEIELVSIN
jgi:FKBP-type peptidyl-prolyl cis-trans isomerase 2